MYYKLISDGLIVDALDSLQCVRYFSNVKKVLRCQADDNPSGVISWQGVIWQVDGWTEFPEGVEVPDLAGTVTLTEIGEEEYTALYAAIQSGIEVEEPEEPEEEVDQTTLEYVRDAKISEMSKACSAAIEAGITVTLSDGAEHIFVLTEADATWLMLMLTNGASAIPCHPDGEQSAFYSAEDVTAITTAWYERKTYQAAYLSDLQAWIGSMTDITEISAIEYGIEIPEEYQSEVLKSMLSGETETTEETITAAEALNIILGVTE